MNILVFSDSHRNVGRMLEVVKNSENMDLILHLGDNTDDAKKIADITTVPILAIKGNTDYSDDPEERILDLEGYKILVTHGHRYKIKSSLQNLYYKSKEADAHIALFGHSHVASSEEIGGILFFNPGSIGDKRGQKYHSYGRITLKEKGLDVAICYLD